MAIKRPDELAENLSVVKSRITNPDVTLIVVTKTYPISDVQILRDLGVENFGENRTEEGSEKAEAVSARWHFQGGIQSRKLKEISSWADVIHSLDDATHATKLDTASSRSLDVFLQLSLDGDPTRGGVTADSLGSLADHVLSLSHLNLVGLMCVLPVEMDAKSGFTQVAAIHRDFAQKYPSAQSLSAGMSGDFEIAIDCGATHIRVGSQILGPRATRG
jgi:pyridoxal phosphate enzyme (YggS family)